MLVEIHSRFDLICYFIGGANLREVFLLQIFRHSFYALLTVQTSLCLRNDLLVQIGSIDVDLL